MSRHYDQASAILAEIGGHMVPADQELVMVQAHATLAVADEIRRLVDAVVVARDAGAERITAVVTGHSDAMAMVDDEIDKMVNAAAPSEWHPYTAGWVAGLAELRRRLHEVDEPAPGCADCPAGCKSCTLDTSSCECYDHQHVALERDEADPLGRVKVGDKESELAGQARVGCAVRKDGLLCMRASHPEQWQHIASDYDGRVLAVWGGVR